MWGGKYEKRNEKKGGIERKRKDKGGIEDKSIQMYAKGAKIKTKYVHEE
jgi:hypothetical protein